MSLSKFDSKNVADLVLNAIASRKNYSAKRLVAPGPCPTQIEEIFTAASSAPDHGNLTPWRFVLIPDRKRGLLGEAFAEALVERDPGASFEDIESAKAKAFNAPLLAIAIVEQSETKSATPNSEKLISLGCAIQNILVTATVIGFGTGLTSGKGLTSKPIRELFKIQDYEECICFINIGTVSSESKVTRIRPTVKNYLTSL
jgi:nitroreductase